MTKTKFSLKKRLHSFRYAFNGLRIIWREEHNFKVHLLAMVLTTALSLLLQINAYEWLAVILAIGFVLVGELLNTAMENLADFVCAETDPRIKRIKDLTAAAVLLSSITALIVGAIIFVPKLYTLFLRIDLL
ncbi:diacylglycerol kinase family protein [Sphingobacterium thalpophilum]|uniref:diacylglycerol kinase family protein n=1 Tax=Sphingobacterium TaxID=28453 RepID=UPI002243195A|nr:diacylglycerol kinase family protein [Sphingobacterium sp. InxBP1]MCW8311267.1 diacylglycerol kinase family protein [Sphingobacterium sp. InxBP1]